MLINESRVIPTALLLITLWNSYSTFTDTNLPSPSITPSFDTYMEDDLVAAPEQTGDAHARYRR
jgi:hypothetical protein